MTRFTLQFDALIDLTDRARTVAVVGEPEYQARLREFASGRADASGVVKFTAGLVPEADTDAIMVMADDVSSNEDFSQIGHLSRDDAARYRPVLAEIFQRGWFPYCEGRLVGGRHDTPSIGAVLLLAGPRECRRMARQMQTELRVAELRGRAAERLPEPRDGWIDFTGRISVSLIANRRCREALGSLRARLPAASGFKVVLQVDDDGAVLAKTLDGQLVGKLSSVSRAKYRHALVELQTAPIRAMCDAKFHGGTIGGPGLKVRLMLLPPDTCGRATAAALRDLEPPQLHAHLL